MIRRSIRLGVCAAVSSVFAISCVTITSVNPDDNGGGGGGGDANQITVRVVNASPNRAVDVQLYATGQGVGNPDTDLFIPANQRAAGIGFAGSGILPAGQTDEMTVACAEANAVGTRGGVFLNQDTGEAVGTGTQYVLFQITQFQCGSTIVFTYAPSGNGFLTSVQIIPPQP
jgi:hypothetical protein